MSQSVRAVAHRFGGETDVLCAGLHAMGASSRRLAMIPCAPRVRKPKFANSRGGIIPPSEAMYVAHDDMVRELAALLRRVPNRGPVYIYLEDQRVSSAYWIARLMQDDVERRFGPFTRYPVTSVDDIDPEDLAHALRSGTRISLLFLDDALYSGTQQDGRVSAFIASCAQLADTAGVALQRLLDAFDLWVLAVYISALARTRLHDIMTSYLTKKYDAVMPTLHLLSFRDDSSAPMFDMAYPGDDHVDHLPKLFFDHKVADTTDTSIARRLVDAGKAFDRSPVSASFPEQMGRDAHLAEEIQVHLRDTMRDKSLSDTAVRRGGIRRHH
jgi:hypothetical protein